MFDYIMNRTLRHPKTPEGFSEVCVRATLGALVLPMMVGALMLIHSWAYGVTFDINSEGVGSEEVTYGDLTDSGSKTVVGTIEANTEDLLLVLDDILLAVDLVPTVVTTRKVSLEAGVNILLTTGLDAGVDRLYIEVTVMDPKDVLWVNIGGPGVVGQTRRVTGGIGLRLPRGYTLGIISETAVDIFVTEGGRTYDEN